MTSDNSFDDGDNDQPPISGEPFAPQQQSYYPREQQQPQQHQPSHNQQPQQHQQPQQYSAAAAALPAPATTLPADQ